MVIHFDVQTKFKSRYLKVIKTYFILVKKKTKTINSIV